MNRATITTFFASALLLTACGSDDIDTVDESSEAALEGIDAQALTQARLAAAREHRSFFVELDAAAFAATSQRLSHWEMRPVSGMPYVVVDLDSAAEREELERMPGVLAVYPNRVIEADGKGGNGGGGGGKPGGGGDGGGGGGGDVRDPQQIPSGVARVGAPDAWATATGAGVGVAVLDTGIDRTHPDLVAAAAPQCFSAFEGEDCEDHAGHGTHVAGIVAAADDEGDVVGVAPGATVYSVRVLDANGSGTDETLIDGLNWVLANHDDVSLPAPIRVVNMSLGRPAADPENQALLDALQAVHDAGIAVVVSAGNTATNEISDQMPAGHPAVIPVASTTAADGASPTKGACAGMMFAADTASYFTTDGDGVLSAPGEKTEDIAKSCLISSVGILSDAMGGGTTRKSGTSMASPTVAGVVALLIEANDAATGIALTPTEIEDRLASTADGVGVAPLDSLTSNYSFDGTREGVVDAVAAIAG